MKKVKTMESKTQIMSTEERNMIKKIKKYIKWNENGEIIYKKKSIKNSNIINLIKHFLHPMNEKSPHGYEIFKQMVIKQKKKVLKPPGKKE